MFDAVDVGFVSLSVVYQTLVQACKFWGYFL
jgi:hypothetical protein